MRLRPRRVLLVLALLVLARSVEAQTIADLMGRPVSSVTFDVEGRPDTSPALLALVDVSVGKPLTLEDIRSSEDHLMNLNLYDDVTPVGTPGPNGIDIVFRLIPRHPIARIVVSGTPGLAPDDLRNQILQQYGGIPASRSRQEIMDTAQQILNDAGYLQASVTSDVALQHAPEAAILTLNVDAGPLARITHTDVRGTTMYSGEEIMRRTGSAPGQPYRRSAIEAALSSLEDDLRARGYYEAQATMSPTITGANVDLRVTVDPGPHIVVKVEPLGDLPGDMATLIPVERERSADQDLLDDSKANIVRSLQNDGYSDARVDVSSDLSSDDTVQTVTFTITKGPRYYVDSVDFAGSSILPADELRRLLAVAPGDVFREDQYNLGLARIVAAYFAAGYYKADRRADRSILGDRSTPTRAWVALHPVITPGPRGTLSAVTFQFTGDHVVTEGELRQVMAISSGQSYVATSVAAAQDAASTLYRDRGFLNASVRVVPSFSADGTSVNVAVNISEGIQVVVGEIQVFGAVRVSESSIRDEIQLKEGQPLTDAALQNAQRRLYDMGGFQRASVTVETLSGEREARVIVSVVEAAATTTSFGGGLEVVRQLRSATDGGEEPYIAASPSALFDIGRQNVRGSNGSVDFFSRVTLRPASVPGDPLRDGRGFGFTEYRTAVTYRERRLFHTNNDFLASVSSEQARRTTFNFARQSASASILHPISSQLSLSGNYELNFTRLFDERFGDPNSPECMEDPTACELPVIDRLFPQVRLSIFSSTLSWDRRDNPLSATTGTFVTVEPEVAARIFGSQVGYAKILLQASEFYPLQTRSSTAPRPRTVLALRAELGLAHGFSQQLQPLDQNGVPELDADGNPKSSEVSEVPASQRFYAGGGNTVRGFLLDTLGVPEILDINGLSSGGNGLIILNAELRQTIGKLFGHDLGFVVFMDGGQVFQNASDVSLDGIRGTTGFGGRWDSPLGPIRLDFGFKLHRETFQTSNAQSNTRESLWEYHLSIGEAF